jgi:capsid portal protein
MEIHIKEHFLNMKYATNDSTCLVQGIGGPYTLEEMKAALSALERMVEQMETDKFNRGYDDEHRIDTFSGSFDYRK